MSRVAFLGNHTPRQCGIATFTADLSSALCERNPTLDAFVVAMNDTGAQHQYPPQVRLQVPEAELGAYHRAANFLNSSGADVVSVQHEYGIYGGAAGAHLLSLVRALRMPIVTTLHTIVAEPSAEQRAVMDELTTISRRLVVMSESGAALLHRVHSVPLSKIDLIPHGIPELPDPGESRANLGMTGKHVILTFGLLSPDKGIEHAIDALVTIAERYPDVVYLVVGATHPHVKQRQGEAYRTMLKDRGRGLGLEHHLIFHDRFVSHEELVQFLAAADVYITPYLNAEQITSGTLAYAVGSGKSVISSPYRYARELLADGRGVLVPCRDSDAIAREVIDLFGDPARRKDMERRAAALGQTMKWPVVADSYARSFKRAIADHAVPVAMSRPAPPTRRIAKIPVALPDVSLRHVRTLTDDTGMLQHAAWGVPRYEDGYCLDDNARALMLMTLIEDARMHSPDTLRPLMTRYLAFVRHAFDADSGRFRNFLSYSRQWTEAAGSEDSHGRALWALGTVIGRANDAGRWGLASQLFQAALPATLTFTSPRAWAYTLLGIGAAIRQYSVDGSVRQIGHTLARRLTALHQRTSRPDWPWFEDRLTYCNARLPQALIVSGVWMREPAVVATGLQSLEWLSSIQRADDGRFAPIGSNGFFVRGGTKAEFDQQPVDVCGYVSAALEADRVTRDAAWSPRASSAFQWFLGHNDLDHMLYDPRTGGCQDGLHAERPNENQGAESTLSFLMALVEMHRVEATRTAFVNDRPRKRQQATAEDVA